MLVQQALRKVMLHTLAAQCMVQKESTSASCGRMRLIVVKVKQASVGSAQKIDASCVDTVHQGNSKTLVLVKFPWNSSQLAGGCQRPAASVPSSARRRKAARARWLRTVTQSSCNIWPCSISAASPSRVATARATSQRTRLAHVRRVFQVCAFILVSYMACATSLCFVCVVLCLLAMWVSCRPFCDGHM